MTNKKVIFICDLQDDVYVKLEAGGMSPRISLQEVAAASGRPRGCVYFRWGHSKALKPPLNSHCCEYVHMGWDELENLQIITLPPGFHLQTWLHIVNQRAQGIPGKISQIFAEYSRTPNVRDFFMEQDERVLPECITRTTCPRLSLHHSWGKSGGVSAKSLWKN